MRLRFFAVLLCALGCASAPQATSPDRSTVFGTLKLVPREGVTPVHGGSSPYADRALRDVEFVDYDHPGFAVVYLDGQAAPGGTSEIAIRASALRTRLEPAQLAAGAGGTLRVRNESTAPHVVSFPSAGRIAELAPGQTLELALGEAGVKELFLLDVPGCEARLFAAPGPFAAVASDGRWEIRNAAPGRAKLVAWHARFPASERWVELAAGQATQVDFEVGVGLDGKASDAAN